MGENDDGAIKPIYTFIFVLTPIGSISGVRQGNRARSGQ